MKKKQENSTFTKISDSTLRLKWDLTNFSERVDLLCCSNKETNKKKEDYSEIAKEIVCIYTKFKKDSNFELVDLQKFHISDLVEELQNVVRAFSKHNKEDIDSELLGIKKQVEHLVFCVNRCLKDFFFPNLVLSGYKFDIEAASIAIEKIKYNLFDTLSFLEMEKKLSNFPTELSPENVDYFQQLIGLCENFLFSYEENGYKFLKELFSLVDFQGKNSISVLLKKDTVQRSFCSGEQSSIFDLKNSSTEEFIKETYGKTAVVVNLSDSGFGSCLDRGHQELNTIIEYFVSQNFKETNLIFLKETFNFFYDFFAAIQLLFMKVNDLIIFRDLCFKKEYFFKSSAKEALTFFLKTVRS